MASTLEDNDNNSKSFYDRYYIYYDLGVLFRLDFLLFFECFFFTTAIARSSMSSSLSASFACFSGLLILFLLALTFEFSVTELSVTSLTNSLFNVVSSSSSSSSSSLLSNSRFTLRVPDPFGAVFVFAWVQTLLPSVFLFLSVALRGDGFSSTLGLLETVLSIALMSDDEGVGAAAPLPAFCRLFPSPSSLTLAATWPRV
mmetsp:Transcript_10129/g.20240  ORF Transcript_10129/g.20240 Transcript_10129/m.20240 type:complete len:200 (+) Transcript_10129:318-917(+)